MVPTERLHRAHQEADAVDRQRIVHAQLTELRMWWSACAHVVFRVHLKKSDGLADRIDFREMLRLEADAAPVRKLRGFHRKPRSTAARRGSAASSAPPRGASRSSFTLG